MAVPLKKRVIIAHPKTLEGQREEDLTKAMQAKYGEFQLDRLVPDERVKEGRLICIASVDYFFRQKILEAMICAGNEGKEKVYVDEEGGGTLESISLRPLEGLVHKLESEKK